MSLRSRFLDLAMKVNAIRFGCFRLKSGRESPYFFDASRFVFTGQDIAEFGELYAEAIVQRMQRDPSFDFDVLFGPAYKGIPLAVSTAVALARRSDGAVDKAVCFNRKEAKDHGEGGALVGAPLEGKRVLLIDDVITAGTAVREACEFIDVAGGKLVGVIIAMDRQEVGVGVLPGFPSLTVHGRAEGTRSAIEEVSDQRQVPVFSIADVVEVMNELSERVKSRPEMDSVVSSMKAYLERYGSDTARAMIRSDP